MRDIYHALVTHDFSKVSDRTLAETRDIYGDASMGINFAMQVIGNLLQELQGDKEYSDQDAKRDLFLIGSVLRQFPRMSQALDQNSSNAEFELKKRKGAAK
ncbi:hypothetical protein ACQ86O_08065 [Serratia sp. L9]|uniref:hypothetical protein n=1 Tax=Serratia sp. L9 TaxID=3423946 RepID=UPI003D67ED37